MVKRTMLDDLRKVALTFIISKSHADGDRHANALIQKRNPRE